MTWIRLDDKFSTHPRMIRAGINGRGLFIAGLCYCGEHLTDGRIPKGALPILVAQAGVKSTTWKILVEIGSWIDHGDEFEVHDFLVYNPSREQVMNERGKRERKRELHSDPGLVQTVRRRDLNLCRYCSTEVSWTDRRGPKGATYDHVDPEGGNTEDNVVVACRGCNSKKGKRTPEQARMPLLVPPGSDLDPILNGNSFHLAPVPSRPVPFPLRSSSSLTSVGADDDVPDELWPLVAKRKLATQSSVRNPSAWLQKAEFNAKIELHDRASELLSEYAVSMSQLADALVANDVPGSWNNFRRVGA